MGIIGEKIIKQIEEAENAGNWDRVLYLLEQAIVLARENYRRLNNGESTT